jgi:hypothetical protein
VGSFANCAKGSRLEKLIASGTARPCDQRPEEVAEPVTIGVRGTISLPRTLLSFARARDNGQAPILRRGQGLPAGKT